MLRRFFKSKAAKAAEELHQAQIRWRAARKAYDEARSRKDTRGMNAALREVRAWATVAVRLEVGR